MPVRMAPAVKLDIDAGGPHVGVVPPAADGPEFAAGPGRRSPGSSPRATPPVRTPARSRP